MLRTAYPTYCQVDCCADRPIETLHISRSSHAIETCEIHLSMTFPEDLILGELEAQWQRSQPTIVKLYGNVMFRRVHSESGCSSCLLAWTRFCLSDMVAFTCDRFQMYAAVPRIIRITTGHMFFFIGNKYFLLASTHSIAGVTSLHDVPGRLAPFGRVRTLSTYHTPISRFSRAVVEPTATHLPSHSPVQ